MPNNETKLHEAAYLNQTHKVKKLIAQNGDSINSPGFNGKTPLHYALQGTREAAQVHAYSKQNFPLTTPSTCDEFLAQCAKNVQILIDAGADLNAQDDDGNTALHHGSLPSPLLNIVTISSLHELTIPSIVPEDISQSLLNANADPNVKNAHGDTPLHLAAIFNQPAVVSLLNAKADPNVKNNNGNTVIESLEKHKEEIENYRGHEVYETTYNMLKGTSQDIGGEMHENSNLLGDVTTDKD